MGELIHTSHIKIYQGPLLIVWDRLPAHRSRLVREFIDEPPERRAYIENFEAPSPSACMGASNTFTKSSPSAICPRRSMTLQ